MNSTATICTAIIVLTVSSLGQEPKPEAGGSNPPRTVPAGPATLSSEANIEFTILKGQLNTRRTGTSAKAKEEYVAIKTRALEQAANSPAKYKLLDTFVSLLKDRTEDSAVQLLALHRVVETFETWAIPSVEVDKVLAVAEDVLKNKNDSRYAPLRGTFEQLLAVMLKTGTAISPGTRLKAQTLANNVTASALEERAAQIDDAQKALTSPKTPGYWRHLRALESIGGAPGITQAEISRMVKLAGSFLNAPQAIQKEKQKEDDTYNIQALESFHSLEAVPYLEAYAARGGVPAVNVKYATDVIRRLKERK